MKNVINRAIMAKKKFIFTLMLAIAASVCMMKAACLMQAPEAMYQPFETVSGTLTSIGFPCEGEEPCPPCLTIALVTDAKTYYLSTSDAQMQAQLDELEMQLPLRATISGTPYQNGSFDFIKVLDIVFETEKLHSLCDTWNVLEVDGVTCGGCEVYRTMKYCLTTDTIIGSTHYVKLMKGNAYEGALREGNNRDIYFIPSGSTHEYLLYDFNAQVGDKLTNLWVGDTIKSATIIEIEPTTPRTFVLSVEYYQSGYLDTTTVAWIEGVGSLAGPTGRPGFIIPNSRAYSVLCAYKNGELIYVSEMGAEYGCEHDQTPEPTDTIPLYSHTGDDPGSSTVDPVDPNQVVATLQGNQLTIRENMGVDITYSLLTNAPAQTPAQHRAPQSDTFRDMVTLQITESGEYLLQLTNPSWDYTIFGRFTYIAEGIERIESASAPQKTLINGQIYILRGDRVYTLQGQEVR